jgi:hypothetical protein
MRSANSVNRVYDDSAYYSRPAFGKQNRVLDLLFGFQNSRECADLH